MIEMMLKMCINICNFSELVRDISCICNNVIAIIILMYFCM